MNFLSCYSMMCAASEWSTVTAKSAKSADVEGLESVRLNFYWHWRLIAFVIKMAVALFRHNVLCISDVAANSPQGLLANRHSAAA